MRVPMSCCQVTRPNGCNIVDLAAGCCGSPVSSLSRSMQQVHTSIDCGMVQSSLHSSRVVRVCCVHAVTDIEDRRTTRATVAALYIPVRFKSSCKHHAPVQLPITSSNGGTLPEQQPSDRTRAASAQGYLSRLRTTLLTLSRFRSTYVCPTPQNIIGAPDVYTMDSAAPTCERARRVRGRVRVR